MRYFGIFNCFNVILAALISISLAQQKTFAAQCPCDIYAAGGTPCVAAHSTVRALYSSYNGPLYQVRRLSDGKTKDIGVLTPGGVANAAAQDSFLTGTTGRISIVYDQSPKGNNLTSPPTCLPSCRWGPADTNANPTDGKITLNGHTVYGIYTYANFSSGPSDTIHKGIGYRNDSAKGLADSSQPEGMYMVCSGTHYNQYCCFDYGNVERNNIDDGNATMECIYFGNSNQWGHGSGYGPWIMADLENGMVAGGTTGIVSSNTPIIANYVTGMVKGNSNDTFAIRDGNADSGGLKTMYKGPYPSGYWPMHKQGGIALGTGGDNSTGGDGTFFEGAITTGYPSDSIENAIQANIIAAGYGSTVTATRYSPYDEAPASPFKVRYNPSSANVAVSCFLQDARRVSMSIVDLRGRQIAAIFDGVIPAGLHEVVWDVKQVPAGVYGWKIALDGRDGWTGKIVTGR